MDRRYPARELARMCELFFPEERRHEFTHLPWDGVSFRHYRDPKIVCLEYYQPPPLSSGKQCADRETGGGAVYKCR